MKNKAINKVYIIGAGPGDPELLTVKAARLLKTYPDIVIYDNLISDDVIKLINPKAKLIFAGKSKDKHFMEQPEINQQIVKHAKKGLKVIRLKGGDPTVFGRLGEEITAIAKHNIPFQIIPGITSASACSANAFFPLTHRDHANNIYFVTGHSQKGKKLILNWKAMASKNSTVVVYMGVANIHKISVNLIKNGLSPSTSCAIIQAGSTSNERKIFTTLKNLKRDAEKHEIKTPALIIIGNVTKIGKIVAKTLKNT